MRKRIPNFSPCRVQKKRDLHSTIIESFSLTRTLPGKKVSSHWKISLCIKIYYLRNRIIFPLSRWKHYSTFFISSDFKTLSCILKGLLPSSRHSNSLTYFLRKFCFFFFLLFLYWKCWKNISLTCEWVKEKNKVKKF